MSATLKRGYTVEAKNDAKALGPWANADLARTAYEQRGIGATSDLPQEVRFIAGVVQLIRARLAYSGGSSDPGQPAVFLLEPSPPSQPDGLSPKRIPMLDNGLTPLTGRLWFVGAAVVSGHFVPVENHDDDSLFSFVTNVLNLGHVPAVLLDPRTGVPDVRFYASGLKNQDDYRRLPLGGIDLSLDRILEAINDIYSQCLITPDAQPSAGKLWEDSDKWHPVKDAEAVIQWTIKPGLAAAFPSCTVRHEQSSVPGRVDLEIEENDPLDRGRVVRHAVLELKVLRSFWSTGTVVSNTETLSWIDSGVRQAAAYRSDKGARAAALCCFDMRRENSGETCFEHVLTLAETLDVKLRRWYLFASSSLYREYRTQ